MSKEEAERMRGNNTGSLDITLGRSEKKEKENTRNIFKCNSQQSIMVDKPLATTQTTTVKQKQRGALSFAYSRKVREAPQAAQSWRLTADSSKEAAARDP